MSPLRRFSLHRLMLVLGTGAALLPATAMAAGNPVIRDCTDDGRLSKKYSQQQYSDALKNIPTDVDEYTDCRDVIRRAQLGSASTGGGSGATNSGGGGAATGGSGGGGGTSGGATGDGAQANTADEALKSASPSEKAAIDQARNAATSTPIRVGDSSLTPDQLTKTDLGAFSNIPTPLVIVLALLALASLTGAGSAILSRVRAHRSSTPA